MRAVFSSLVALSLLMHAALGCCRHADGQRCASALASAQTSDECAHHHDVGDHPGQPTDEPCSGHHCDGLCNYLPIQKSQLDDLKLQLPLDLAIISPAACDMQAVAVHEKVYCESVPEPPVRLHLLHQILLI
jgi:hypothetical protein